MCYMNFLSLSANDGDVDDGNLEEIKRYMRLCKLNGQAIKWAGVRAAVAARQVRYACRCAEWVMGKRVLKMHAIFLL